MSRQVSDMTEEELKNLIRETIESTMISIGIDLHDPIAMQRDAQFARDFRLSAERMKSTGVKASVGIFVTGVATLIYLGVLHKIYGG